MICLLLLLPSLAWADDESYMTNCFRHQAVQLGPWSEKPDMVDSAKLIVACPNFVRDYLRSCSAAQSQLAINGNPPPQSCGEIVLQRAGQAIDCAVDSAKLGYDACK